MSEQLFIKQMSIFTDSTRLKIINLLDKSDFCAMHIEQLTGVSQPNISRHIDKMITAQIVVATKSGRRNIYALDAEFKANYPEIISQINSLYQAELDLVKISALSSECKEMK